MADKQYTPPPWGAKEMGVPMDEEYAFYLSALPVNSLPFLRRLTEVLEEFKTNSLKTFPPGSTYHWKARALLWVINAQIFGELAGIDMSKEWEELHKAYKEGKF